MKEPDKYLDIRGLAQYSSLSVRTLRNYLTDEADPIPSYCIKRKLLVKRSEFDGWMKRYRTKTGKISSIVEEVLNGFEVD